LFFDEKRGDMLFLSKFYFFLRKFVKNGRGEKIKNKGERQKEKKRGL
jgi:hypothetical protein